MCACTRLVRLHGVHIWPPYRSRRLSSFASRVLDAHPVCTVPRRVYPTTSETTFCFPDAGKRREPPLYRETLAAPCIIDRRPEPTLFTPPSGPRLCHRTIVLVFQTSRRSSARSKVASHPFRTLFECCRTQYLRCYPPRPGDNLGARSALHYGSFIRDARH